MGGKSEIRNPKEIRIFLNPQPRGGMCIALMLIVVPALTGLPS
jgi:hypothetical protein